MRFFPRYSSCNVLAVLCLAAACGCATVQPKQGSSSSISSRSSTPTSVTTGAREVHTIALPEIVASVPVEGASQPYQNIHVNLELTIEVSGASPKSGTPIDELLKSLGSSVNAYLLQTLTEGKTLSARNLGLLRDNLTSQARIIVESWLAEKHGPEIYKAEALVVSLYFTGPSIGRSPSR